MPEQSFNPSFEDEISLKHIIDFLIESWKSIVVTVLLGVLGSIGYLAVTPNQYQAIAQIQMAQVNVNNVTNPFGVNVEDPNLLLVRLKLPTSYSAETIKTCGLENTSDPLEYLASIAKFSVVKGVGSIVELKISRDTKGGAINCAHALFEVVQTSQNQIIEPYIEQAKLLLGEYEVTLANSQSLLSRADKSGAALSATYLANRDEVRSLAEEILNLKTFITTADARRARLISPVYAADAPVFPKMTVSLIVGLMAGLFLGLLLAIGKKYLKPYKTV